MRRKWVMGNWKMNGRMAQLEQLALAIKDNLPELSHSKCVLFPPFVYIPMIANLLNGTSIKWGAQNVFPKSAGAFTGEISTPMLMDYNCQYVLVGHSERRHVFHESEKFVAEKFHHVKEHDMIPVLCVGETLAERESGQTKEIIAHQLDAILRECPKEKLEQCFKDSIVAYEPVWAIGTGLTPTPEQVQDVHIFIREWVAKFNDHATMLPILYGGSVTDKNASQLFDMQDVDGGLIGGASLNAEQFVDIVKCIN